MQDLKHLKRFRGRNKNKPLDLPASKNILFKISILLGVLSSLFYISDGGIACLSNPCVYGLCVDDVNSSYSCYCVDGYTGTNCQTEWDECWSQPCFNGGDCFDLVANYNCSCLEGFSGLSCEVDRDECLSDPCQNNGTCVDGSNGFKCHCLPGFTGSVCEWDISVCNETGTERCLNGGACVEGLGERFWCICSPGWGGAICEEPLDPCLILQPCLHGGLCLPRGSEFICACPFGFSGENCEFELAICKENPCMNGAICIEEANASVCYCVPDFHGDFCQFQYDECLLPPTPSCKNGGTCIDGVDGFSCSCPPDVTGRYCECPIGQDCSNHTHHPILPTTEQHWVDTSTIYSKRTSRKPFWPHGGFTKSSKRLTTATLEYSTTSFLNRSPTFSNTAQNEVGGENAENFTRPQGRVTSAGLSPKEDPGLSKSSTSIILDLMPKFSTSTKSTHTTVLDKFETTETITPDSDSFVTNDGFDYPGEGDISKPSEVSSKTSIFKIDSTTTENFSNEKERTKQTGTSKSMFASKTTKSNEGLNTDDDEEEDSKLQSVTPTTPTNFFSDLDTTTDYQISMTEFTASPSTSIISDENESSSDPTLTTTTLQVNMTGATSSLSTGLEVLNATEEIDLETDKDTIESATSIEVTLDLSLSSPSTSTLNNYGNTSTTEGSSSSSSTRSATDLPYSVSTSSVLGGSTKVEENDMDGNLSTAIISFSKNTLLPSATITDKDFSEEDRSTVPTFIESFSKSTMSQKVTGKNIVSSSTTSELSSKKISTVAVNEKSSTVAGEFSVGHVTKGFPHSSSTEAAFSSELPDYGSATPDYVDTTVAEPKKCKSESPCLNGGECFSLDSKIVCRCPFQFTGNICELPTNYTEVSLLPTSWLLFRVVSTVNDSESMRFTHMFEATFRIVSEEGVVFTLAEANEEPMSNYYMQMSIYHGRLQLQFSCGLQSVKFSESKQRIDTGQPTRISASLSMWIMNKTAKVGRCRAELKLNNTLAISGEQSRPLATHKKDALAHLVFGSWPRAESSKNSEEEDIYSEKISTSPGVVACLSEVKVNEKLKLLLADVTAGSSDVSECIQLACLSNPCLYGGTCDETSSNSWSCRCPNGRLGARCEISVCENSPCQAGGTCLVHPGTNFVCLCPLGREGIFCEKEHLITKPCFFPTFVDMNPFLALPLMPRHESFRHAIEVSLKFNPTRTHQVALLSYIGHGPRDHVALGYVHGRIILTWDLGSGPRRIFTNIEFLAGTEHEVKFGRSGKEGWLKVKGDNMTHSGNSVGKMIQLNTRPIAFFGGFDDGNMSIMPHDLPKHAGFEGCLSHLEIKTAAGQVSKFFPPGPPNSPLKGRSVMQQDFNICASNPCRQKGICLPHGPSFTCLCTQGWFGPLCAEPRNPCDTMRNMCAEGSTCVPLQFGYECDCPLGKSGRFCNSVEVRSSVVWPELYFSGKRSYLEVPRSLPSYSDPGQLEHSCVEFELKTQAWKGAPAAQILFISQDPDTGDFMTLLLTADRVLELILGSRDEAPLILSSPRGVSVRAGVWVRIRAGRVGRRVFLSVGGRSVSSWLLPGQSASWNGGHSTLYIGGTPDLSTVAPVTWLLIRPYSGCIRKLHVDWRKVIVHLGRARISSRGVRTVARQPHKFRHEVAQLSPEFIKQVQLKENGFVPNLGDEIVTLLRGEIMASYVSGNSDLIADLHKKKIHDIHDLGKNEPSWKLNFRRRKEMQILSFINNRTSDDEEGVNEVESSTAEAETTMSIDKITPPGIMTKNLRTRDALFALSARNVKPCDKSGLALLQLDPCLEGHEAELDCLSLPLKDQSLTSLSPGFRGDGWILLRSALFSSNETDHSPVSFLNVKFSSKNSSGLLVWIQQDEKSKAFIGLGLVAGRLQVVWGNNKNTSNTAIVSGMVNDGAFHRVSILWDVGEKVVVWLDGEIGEVENDRKRQKRHDVNQEKTSITIAIGGHPKDHLVSNLVLDYFATSLFGCVAELAWNDEIAHLTEFSSYHHENVFPCNTAL